MAQEMGLGILGEAPDIVFKRKYRWTFKLKPYCTDEIPEAFVKLAARPNLSIEETEINYLHGKMWIPGKGTWEAVTVTYYDIGNNPGITNLYSWLAGVYDFTDPVSLKQSSAKGNTGNPGYAGTGTLNLYDGCGTVMETWTLEGVWPQAINFGELDYSSSEEVTVELTLRFHAATYEAGCGTQFSPCACVGCS
jgi:hypothetical protein